MSHTLELALRLATVVDNEAAKDVLPALLATYYIGVSQMDLEHLLTPEGHREIVEKIQFFVREASLHLTALAAEMERSGVKQTVN